MLLDSVAPEVKTISLGSAPIRAPISLLKCIKCNITFRIDKTSLGVSPKGVATPWYDFPYAKSNANTFVRAHAYRVFLTSCV